MRDQFQARLSAACQPPPRLNIWQWAERNVDFSLAPAYDTGRKDKYSADWMPYWREPAEALTDPNVREVIVLKCSRAGGTENLLLNGIRYNVAVAPKPTLYVTGDQLSAERMMEKRIKRGMKCAPDCWRQYRQAQSTQHDIAFPAMDLRVTWPRAKQAFKQDGWADIYGDEVSTWQEYSTDMLRKRADTYPFPHICLISSPDPAQRRSSDNDPIFVEYDRGDRRRWTCRDPKTGNDFVFQVGSRGGFGLQWDQTAKRDDGTWNMDRVRETAHFVTPDGTRIDGADRLAVVRAGRWVASNPDAPSWCRSYHVTAFMTPFESGDFGSIAVAFLTANERGAMAIRTFLYEYMAEKYAERIESTTDERLMQCEADYQRGQRISQALPVYVSKMAGVIVGADTQKLHVWWAAREYVDGGDSGLVDYGAAATFAELNERAGMLDANRVLVDANYENRRMETFEACDQYAFIPVIGNAGIATLFDITQIDPYEGTRRATGETTLGLMKLNTDVLRSMLLDMLRGESPRKFLIPRGIPLEYIRQVGSTARVDGKWELRKGYSQDHLFDCEVYALAGAVYAGFYRTLFWQPPES